MSDPISDEEFGVALYEVVTSLLARSDEQRKTTDGWKNLWAESENGLRSLLSETNNQTSTVILNTAKVIEERFGIRVTGKLWNLLKALPFAMDEVRDDIKTVEGNSCCADKARQAYYLEVLEEIYQAGIAQGRLRVTKPTTE